MTRQEFFKLQQLNWINDESEEEQFLQGIRSYKAADIFVFYNLFSILISGSGWESVKEDILSYMRRANYQDYWFANYHKSFRQVDVHQLDVDEINGHLDSIMWETMAGPKSGDFQTYLKHFFEIENKRKENDVQN